MIKAHEYLNITTSAIYSTSLRQLDRQTSGMQGITINKSDLLTPNTF